MTFTELVVETRPSDLQLVVESFEVRDNIAALEQRLDAIEAELKRRGYEV